MNAANKKLDATNVVDSGSQGIRFMTFFGDD